MFLPFFGMYLGPDGVCVTILFIFTVPLHQNELSAQPGWKYGAASKARPFTYLSNEPYMMWLENCYLSRNEPNTMALPL